MKIVFQFTEDQINEIINKTNRIKQQVAIGLTYPKTCDYNFDEIKKCVEKIEKIMELE